MGVKNSGLDQRKTKKTPRELQFLCMPPRMFKIVRTKNNPLNGRCSGDCMNFEFLITGVLCISRGRPSYMLQGRALFVF